LFNLVIFCEVKLSTSQRETNIKLFKRNLTNPSNTKKDIFQIDLMYNLYKGTDSHIVWVHFWILPRRWVWKLKVALRRIRWSCLQFLLW